MQSRPTKDNPIDIIIYEIDMLNRSYEEFFKCNSSDIFFKNAYLECYLLHYRNLIEFFGRTERIGQKLSIRKPQNWLMRSLSSEEEYFASGKVLYSEFFVNISNFLSHTHIVRSQEKLSWDVKEMHEKISPLISSFEALFNKRV